MGEFYSPPPTGGLYHKDLMQQSNIVTKAKPGGKLVGHIYKRCRQAEETCKAGRETSRQVEESKISIESGRSPRDMVKPGGKIW